MEVVDMFSHKSQKSQFILLLIVILLSSSIIIMGCEMREIRELSLKYLSTKGLEITISFTDPNNPPDISQLMNVPIEFLLVDGNS